MKELSKGLWALGEGGRHRQRGARPNPPSQSEKQPLPAFQLSRFSGQLSFQRPAEITMTFKLTAHGEENTVEFTRHFHIH